MTYQSGIPTGNVKFSVDYQNIQGNFSVLDTSYGINHFAFSDSSSKKGKHKFVDMPTLNTPVTDTTPPSSLVSGDGAIYTSRPGISTELFYANDGTGAAFKLTNVSAAVAAGNFSKFGTNPGWTFLPGGLILQWGSVTSTANTFQTLTFSLAGNIEFPNNCFSVFTQPFGSGSVPGGGATIEIRKSTLSKTLFNWVYVTGSGQYEGFFWVAIGN